MSKMTIQEQLARFTELDKSTVDKVVVNLLRQDQMLSDFIEGAEAAGIVLNMNRNMDFFAIALDLLGVPAEYIPPEAEEVMMSGGQYDGPYYCRDWIYNLWDEVDKDPEMFVELIRQEKHTPDDYAQDG